jgi:hypothetical protein
LFSRLRFLSIPIEPTPVPLLDFACSGLSESDLCDSDDIEGAMYVDIGIGEDELDLGIVVFALYPPRHHRVSASSLS